MNPHGKVTGRFFKMIAALFTAIIVLLGRLVQNWFSTKDEPEGGSVSEEGREDDGLTFPGDLNYRTGKVDSGLEWGGWYEDK